MKLICNTSGLVFYEEYNGKSAFYLRGIVSIGPKNIGGCDLGFYTLYTNVHKYIPMIQNATIRYPSSYEEIDKTGKKYPLSQDYLKFIHSSRR